MARPVGTLDKKSRYSKNSIYAAVMQQLEYWQTIVKMVKAVEDDEPKRSVRKPRKMMLMRKLPEGSTVEAKSLNAQ